LGRHRWATWGFLVVLLAFTLGPAAAHAGTPPQISFVAESSDPTESAGHRSSIQIDAAGAPHIAYVVWATGELRYASRGGASWVWETVSTEWSVSADLALDSSGEPWIAFHTSVAGAFQDQIKVAHRSAGVWTIDTIGDGVDPHITNAAIAFDPSGVPHVAWGNASRGFRISYATWDASGWSSEFVHQGNVPVDQDFELAFDAQGTPHIVVPTIDGTLYAVFVPPSWVKEIMPFRFMPSLALDSSGQPHIASIRIESFDIPMILEYQWRGTDGVWHQEDLASLSGPYFPPGASLRLDQNDRPLIAITEGATNTVGGTLRLMRKSGDAWITEEVEASGVGLYPSLALADGTLPRISYSIEESGLHYVAGEFAPEVLASRAFLAGGARTLALASPSQPSLCVQLEPLEGAFNAEDLDPASIVMRSDGTGTVNEIAAREGKRAVLGDRDRNGVMELGACFACEDLIPLFSSVEGRTTVAVTIEGSLVSGERVSAPLELTVLSAKGLAARIYPNPMNPTGRLSFTVSRPGSLRVMLFDVAGRMVRVLADDPRVEAGPREIAFDGKNDRGVPLATGIYFYRIESAGDVFQGRVAIAK
jgi:hypothetical protein